MTTCGDGLADGRRCDASPAVPYPRGPRCSHHAPARPQPDPTRTLAALRARMLAELGLTTEEQQ